MKTSKAVEQTQGDETKSGVLEYPRGPLLRAMFNYGIKRGYLLDNQILKLDFIHRVRREVQTIPAPIVAKMLNHAMENDLQLVPFLLLGFFAGIRPDGELQKLEWSDIVFEEKIIAIRPEVSKTNRRRFPRLQTPNRGLMSTSGAEALTEGKIIPFTSNILRTKRRANWFAAAVRMQSGSNRACAIRSV